MTFDSKYHFIYFTIGSIALFTALLTFPGCDMFFQKHSPASRFLPCSKPLEKKICKTYREMFNVFLKYTITPGLIEPKFTEHRKMKGLEHPMIGIGTAQELRKTLKYTSFKLFIKIKAVIGYLCKFKNQKLKFIAEWNTTMKRNAWYVKGMKIKFHL